MKRALWSGTFLLFLLAGCDEPIENLDDGGVELWDPACDNTDRTHCLLPWPSDHFRQGERIALPADHTPVSGRGIAVSPETFAREGFSLYPTLMTVLSPAPDEATLHGQEHIAESLGPDATTVIVNVETGERVPSFAELDHWPDTDPERIPLYIRPAMRLAPSTRYAVGIRGLKSQDGAPLEPSPYFRALRDGTPLEGSDVETRRGDLEDVFGALEATGFERDALILAWGFTTSSEEAVVGDLLTMRDAMLAEPAGACTITEIEEGGELPSSLWRRMHGTVEVPLFLVGPEPASLEASRIARDAEGAPTATDTIELPFLVIVPESLRARVEDGGAPGRAIVYGHGILGTRFEADSGWMHSQASELEAVVFATDWWGMGMPDLSRLLLALSQDFSHLEATTERMHQGIVNVLALSRAIRERCAELPELSLEDGSGPLYDPEQVHYYGNSLGAILGAVVAGVAPDLERAVLGVGGAGWTMLIKRSDAWRAMSAILESSYRDAVERALMVAMSASLWDPVDGATYAPRLLNDPLPGAIPRRVLLQIGIGDVAVSPVSAHMFARSAGLPLTVPSPAEPFGLATTPGPIDSAMTIFRVEDTPPLPPGSRDPGPDTPTHNGVRSLPAARAQLDAFLRPDGQVSHPCGDDPC